MQSMMAHKFADLIIGSNGFDENELRKREYYLFSVMNGGRTIEPYTRENLVST